MGHERSREETQGQPQRHRSTIVAALEDMPPKKQNILIDTIPAVIILLSGLKIGLSADISPGHPTWDIIENVFCACFFLEMVIKMLLWGVRGYFCGEEKLWNLFDFVCVCMSIFDIMVTYVLKAIEMDGSDLAMLKLLRLARLARLIRALHFKFFDELRTMVLGVFAGVKVLVWAIILLFFVIYFLGVFMNAMVGKNEPEFENVPVAMLTIFRCYTEGCSAYDGTPLTVRLFEKYGVLFFLAFILTFMLITVGIFNLIMAIFIDNVLSASVTKKLEEIGEKTGEVERALKDFFAECVADLHTTCNNSGATFSTRFSHLLEAGASVKKKDFNKMLAMPELMAILERADIETPQKKELFDVLDVDMGGELEMDELVNGLMSMRGPITKTDIVGVKLKVIYTAKMIEDLWKAAGFGDDGEDDEDGDEMQMRRKSST